jgi:hypothetical protein
MNPSDPTNPGDPSDPVDRGGSSDSGNSVVPIVPTDPGGHSGPGSPGNTNGPGGTGNTGYTNNTGSITKYENRSTSDGVQHSVAFVNEQNDLAMNSREMPGSTDQAFTEKQSNHLNNEKEKSVSAATQKSASAEADKTAAQSKKSGSGPDAANAIIIPDTYTLPGTGISMWKRGVGLAVGFMELIVLGIISSFVVSDMRVIRWFENKKKNRL